MMHTLADGLSDFAEELERGRYPPPDETDQVLLLVDLARAETDDIIDFIVGAGAATEEEYHLVRKAVGRLGWAYLWLKERLDECRKEGLPPSECKPSEPALKTLEEAGEDVEKLTGERCAWAGRDDIAAAMRSLSDCAHAVNEWLFEKRADAEDRCLKLVFSVDKEAERRYFSLT